MKQRIIEHYEKRIQVNERKLKKAQKNLKDVFERKLSGEWYKLLQDEIKNCENNIELLTEQLEYIKANLK